MRRAAPALLLLLRAVSLVASAQNETDRRRQGAPFTLSGPPRRIVSLAPNVTEILFALGLDEEIVGVTRYCDYPGSGATEAKDRRARRSQPGDDQVACPRTSSSPSAAIRSGPIERLRDLGLPGLRPEHREGPRFALPPHRKDRPVTRRDKEAGGARRRASRTGWMPFATVSRPSTAEPRVFLALHGRASGPAAGRATSTTSSPARRPGTSPAAIARNWLHYGLEQLVRDDPEVIIILARSIRPNSKERRDRFLEDRGSEEVAAVRTGRVSFLDENVASRFGPRLADALEDDRPEHPSRKVREDPMSVTAKRRLAPGRPGPLLLAAGFLALPAHGPGPDDGGGPSGLPHRAELGALDDLHRSPAFPGSSGLPGRGGPFPLGGHPPGIFPEPDGRSRSSSAPPRAPRSAPSSASTSASTSRSSDSRARASSPSPPGSGSSPSSTSSPGGRTSTGWRPSS